MTLEPRDSTCSKDLELKADTPCWEAAPAEVSNGLSALWWHPALGHPAVLRHLLVRCQTHARSRKGMSDSNKVSPGRETSTS